MTLTINIPDELAAAMQADIREPGKQADGLEELAVKILRRHYADRMLSTLGSLLEYRRQFEVGQAES